MHWKLHQEKLKKIEGWPSMKDSFAKGTRIHKIIICSPKTSFFAMEVTLPLRKDCFWEETKTNRVHFPPPSICCWLFTWNNNEKENNQMKVGKEQKGKNKRETKKQWPFSAKLCFSWACELVPIKSWSKQNSTVFFNCPWKEQGKLTEDNEYLPSVT